MYNLLLSAYLSDVVEEPAKWLTIAVLGALVVTYLVMLCCYAVARFSGNNEFAEKSLNVSKGFLKKAGIGFVFYALALGIFLLSAKIAKKYDAAYLEKNWVSLSVVTHVLIPLLVTLTVALIGGIVLFVVSKTKPEKIKPVCLIFGILLGICLIVTLVLIGVHYTNDVVGDGYYSEEINSSALYVCAVSLIVFTVAAALILGRHDKKPFDTHCIALAGICVALSFALSYIKLWDMPAGGSVTLVSLLPVMLFSYIYGTKKGLLVGFLYGILQAVQDPWLIHPAQFLLDYPIAFSMVCFAGTLTDLNLLNNIPQVKFAISAAIGGALRFFSHVLSGVFAFGANAVADGATDFWAYSLAYNSVLFIDIALVIVAGFIIFSSKSFNRQIERLNPKSN